MNVQFRLIPINRGSEHEEVRLVIGVPLATKVDAHGWCSLDVFNLRIFLYGYIYKGPHIIN